MLAKLFSVRLSPSPSLQLSSPSSTVPHTQASSLSLQQVQLSPVLCTHHCYFLHDSSLIFIGLTAYFSLFRSKIKCHSLREAVTVYHTIVARTLSCFIFTPSVKAIGMRDFLMYEFLSIFVVSRVSYVVWEEALYLACSLLCHTFQKTCWYAGIQ